jgi:hypothetical protein
MALNLYALRTMGKLSSHNNRNGGLFYLGMTYVIKDAQVLIRVVWIDTSEMMEVNEKDSRF